MTRLTGEILSRAYRAGIFPMADARDATSLSWYEPQRRGVLPLDRFHLPRRLLRTVRGGGFAVTADRAFDLVLAGCAAAAPGREESWINGEIATLFGALHRREAGGARAHSVECWRDGALAGGLYGLAIGGAFFGESMFSRARDASKVALVHLVARLRLGGFALLDTQFITDHLSQFGATEIAKREYRLRLGEAIRLDARWHAEPPPERLAAAIAGLAAGGTGAAVLPPGSGMGEC